MQIFLSTSQIFLVDYEQTSDYTNKQVESPLFSSNSEVAWCLSCTYFFWTYKWCALRPRVTWLKKHMHLRNRTVKGWLNPKKSAQIQPISMKIRIKSAYLQGFWSKSAYLKCFWTQFKIAYLQGPRT